MSRCKVFVCDKWNSVHLLKYQNEQVYKSKMEMTDTFINWLSIKDLKGDMETWFYIQEQLAKFKLQLYILTI